jgi:hydroxypyruvate isomerase
MPKFAANLSWLFQELPFPDRFAAAAKAGFRGIEILFPYEHPADRIADLLRRHDLQQVLINAPPGDAAAGERGLAALPGREAEFLALLETSLAYAATLDCRQIHVMAGPSATGASTAPSEATYIENLRRGAELARRQDITLLIEPLNRRDAPGYFLSTLEQARNLIERIDRGNVRLQFDLYHAQIMGGDLSERLRAYLPITGHIQIAGVPGRHEPDQGEINYPFLFGLIDELGYDGWIGCEYRPRSGTLAGLGWARNYGIRG